MAAVSTTLPAGEHLLAGSHLNANAIGGVRSSFRSLVVGNSLPPHLASVSSLPAMPTLPAVAPMTSSFSWAAMLQNSSNESELSLISDFVPEIVNGIGIAPSSVVEEGRKDWEEFVVGYFIGKRLAFDFVHDHLKKIWKVGFDCVADKEFFYIKFHNGEDKKKIFDVGPVFIAGRVFVLQQWSPELEGQRNTVNSVPVWIKLTHLPKELWSRKGISFAASLVGKPYRMDQITARKQRLDFARVCVLLTANQPLHKRIPVDVGRITYFEVEYQWIPPQCTHCCRFGHNTTKCMARNVTDLNTENIVNERGAENLATDRENSIQPPNSGVLQRQNGRFILLPPGAQEGNRTPIASSSVTTLQKNSVNSTGHNRENEGPALSNRFALLPDIGEDNDVEIALQPSVEATIEGPENFSLEDISGNARDISESERVEIGRNNPVAFSGTHPLAIGTMFVQSNLEEGQGCGDTEPGVQKAKSGAECDVEVSEEPIQNASTEVLSCNNPCEVRIEQEGEKPIALDGVRSHSVASTDSFLETVNSCLDICNAIVDDSLNAQEVANSSTMVSPVKLNQEQTLKDKGGTFNPSDPDTWPESIKQADKEIALVMARMSNPTPTKEKKGNKLDLKVNLVKGHSGAILRSSSRNKR